MRYQRDYETTESYLDIVNCTRHNVNIMDGIGNVTKVIIPSGRVPRLRPKTECVGSCNGVRLTRTKYGAAVGIPPEIPGVIYIVSAIIAKGLPNRKDFVIPNELVRDSGTVMGCKSLGFM